MQDHPQEGNEAVFTIGHSNHSPELFIDLLRGHGIEVVVDVRSSPYSGYAAHFNKEGVEKRLKAAGIRYLFLGDEVGGRPEGDEFYDGEGYVLYNRVAASSTFQNGIDRLAKGARNCRIALMCGEEDPTDCHRRRLVGRVLLQQGVDVLHIRGDGRVQTEQEVAKRETLEKTKGQLSLFETEDPNAWRSTRSASPGKARPTSSGRSNEVESSD